MPSRLRKELQVDPYYINCCLRAVRASERANMGCSGRIEWHHNARFGGSNIQERFAILPLCKIHHRAVNQLKEKLDQIMLNRATDDQIKKISKAVDYQRLKIYLNKKYGDM